MAAISFARWWDLWLVAAGLVWCVIILTCRNRVDGLGARMGALNERGLRAALTAVLVVLDRVLPNGWWGVLRIAVLFWSVAVPVIFVTLIPCWRDGSPNLAMLFAAVNVQMWTSLALLVGVLRATQYLVRRLLRVPATNWRGVTTTASLVVLSGVCMFAAVVFFEVFTAVLVSSGTGSALGSAMSQGANAVARAFSGPMSACPLGLYGQCTAAASAPLLLVMGSLASWMLLRAATVAADGWARVTCWLGEKERRRDRVFQVAVALVLYVLQKLPALAA